MHLALILIHKIPGKSFCIFASNHKPGVEFSGFLALAEDHSALKTKHWGREGVCRAVAGAQSSGVLRERSPG